MNDQDVDNVFELRRLTGRNVNTVRRVYDACGRDFVKALAVLLCGISDTELDTIYDLV